MNTTTPTERTEAALGLDDFAHPTLLLDASGRVLAANRSFPQAAFKIVTNAPLAETLAHPEGFLSVLRAAQQADGFFPVTLRAPHRETVIRGTLHARRSAAAVTFLLQGEEVGGSSVFALSRHLRERESEARLERLMRQQAVERVRAAEELLDVLAHDTRTPLSSAILALRMLKESLPPDTSECEEYVTTAESSIERLLNFMKHLFARTRLRQATPEVTTVALRPLLAEVETDLEARLAETGGRIVAPALGSVRADPQLLRQLLLNLCGNALTYRAPDRAPVVTVTLERISETHGELRVADNGRGFPPTEAARLFEPFYRDAGGHGDGLGLGLAICRSIAQNHGWGIRAIGEVGVGATFVVRLPWIDPA